MARPHLLASTLLILAALSGCRSDDAAQADFPCICGTPDAAVTTCLHPLCVSEEGNDENPDCVCGTLSFPE